MTFEIDELRLRGIYDSRGLLTTEAGIVLKSKAQGRGSSPRAIAPGKLEQFRGSVNRLGVYDRNSSVAKEFAGLRGRAFLGQEEFDGYLEQHKDLGTTVTVALSLAFGRAAAAEMGVPFWIYLTRLAKLTGNRPFPRPLVNVISGGIHDPSGKNPFQQIFIVPTTDDFINGIHATRKVFDHVETELKKRSQPVVYSASSGMIVSDCSHYDALELIAGAISRLNLGDNVRLGFDVAAEHLRDEHGLYQFGATRLDADQVLDALKHLSQAFAVSIIEDPFDALDKQHWRALTTHLGDRAHIIGDDLFATDQRRIDPYLANGILLKLDQIGTVTGLVATARRARSMAMATCQSHRSGETEDTSMCDLSVALGADFIKIGGPRRGDRIAKYNQLIRLHEQIKSERTGNTTH